MPIRGYPPQVAYAAKAETYEIDGRVANNGTASVTAPAVGPAFTVSRTGTGTVNVVFFDPIAEFLGAQITLEGTASSNIDVEYTWTSSTLTMVVTTAKGGALVDQAFAFQAVFTDNPRSV